MYTIKLFEGYEGMCFIGMEKEEVILNMPQYEKTIYSGINQEARVDIGKDFFAYYDESNEFCDAIEFMNDKADVYVNGTQFMGLSEAELRLALKKVFPNDKAITDGERYTYANYSLAFGIIEGKVETLLVGKKGYFDNLVNEIEYSNGPTDLRYF